MPARRNQARLRCGAGEDRRADAGRFTGRHRGAVGVGRHRAWLRCGCGALTCDYMSWNHNIRPVERAMLRCRSVITSRPTTPAGRLCPGSTGMSRATPGSSRHPVRDNSKKRGTWRGTEPARGRRVSTPPFGMIGIFTPNGGVPSPCGLSQVPPAAGVIGARPGRRRAVTGRSSG
jgi:hypothetical protein